MSLPRLPGCCACTSVRTGALIIGGINLAAGLIALLVSFALMACAGAFVSETAEILNLDLNDIEIIDVQNGEFTCLLHSSFTFTFP